MARLKHEKEKRKAKPKPGAEALQEGEERGNGKAGFYGRLPELRPRAQVLAQQGLDDETIATLLKEPVERVQNYLANELKFGRAQLKARIMRAQIECAVEGHDSAMLKRLGEEYCGQGVITQQGAIANAGKAVFVLNVGAAPKDLDGPPPGPVRVLPAKKVDTLDAEFDEVQPEG